MLIFLKRFAVDLEDQSILFKQCINCTNLSTKRDYYLTLICKDNNGYGNIASSAIILNLKNLLTNPKQKVYFLLATGPENTDIPYLALKVIQF